ncbi:sensor domain-containing protein [Pseudoduganella violacea]|uniref:Diguanylate cyclase (GGDEF)-like protein/PAS domain S-box-containing protein n=1 Tax=Pseudoduganella violacea TaxID=1715466 RepID=A0A7W5BCP6_9BURK|nr:EAL domain-containing protein [Pseudoduganella violacea]MBB3120446.1 diguanylate cyclase (GGDEF)-like protein/PAS domain S-box-containing protein [Pseudoduganella violacea]
MAPPDEPQDEASAAHPQPHRLPPPSPYTAHEALQMIARLVEAMEITPLVSAVSFDRDWRVRFCNPACAGLCGLAPEQLYGRSIRQLFFYDEREAEYEAMVEEVWRSGQPATPREWWVRTLNGRRLWLYSICLPIFSGGELKQIFCMKINLTERKQGEEALARASANFQSLFQKSADAMLLIRNNEILDANPAALGMFACASREQLVGHSLANLSPMQQPDGSVSAPAVAELMQQALSQTNCRFDWRFLSCEGSLFWGEVLLTSISQDHHQLFYAQVHNVTERKKAERTLALAAQVFESSREGIVLTDRHKRVIAVNRAYSEITGFSAEAMAGQPLEHFRSAEEDESFFRQLWGMVDASSHWQGEIRLRHRDGHVFPALVALTTIRGSGKRSSHYMAILSDISERKKNEEHTRHLAEHDFLTDLPNRVLLADRLSQALTAARRHHSMLALLFIDLDHFKGVNDTLGHHTGDLLLKEVARRLTRCVRGGDTVSRQGGDEFILILPEIGGVEHAAHVAASVRQAVGQEYRLAGHQLSITASIGVAIYPHDGADADSLLRHADMAMFHAKESGRDRFHFFSPDMNARMVERGTLEEGLRRALDEQQFALEFQPLLALASGAPVGMEALLRWHHPELGVLPPARFLAVAEESGLMLPIGAWVLQQACRQAQRWHEHGQRLTVAVNLSAAQFMQKSLPDQVAQALQTAGLEPACLELELTETMLLKNGPQALDTLRSLAALGVRLALDDFGSGYSSLEQLRSYPIHKLKIAPAFLRDGGDAGAIRAIIAMAHGLGMAVVAEAVETAEQLDLLRQEGCDLYQGQQASAALPQGELERLLQ